MKRLLIAAALLALALTGAASGGHAPAITTVSSTRLVKGGHIRITATFARTVQVGHPLQVSYRIQNVSKVTRTIKLTFGLWYVVRSPDGTIYDTRVLLRDAYVPVVPPKTLRPGQVVTSSGPQVRVRWAGPLRVTPGWDKHALPTVSVEVKSPGAPSRHGAIRDVLAATGHLLDHCAPTVSGVPVVGRIDAPKNSAPPLRTRCSVSLHAEHGFFQAQVLVVSPANLRVRVSSPYLWLRGIRPGQNTTAIAWIFVVTRHGAVSVDSTSVESTRNVRRSAPGWQWTTAGFQPQAGGTRCGGTGGGGGGYIGPYVEFVSKCHR